MDSFLPPKQRSHLRQKEVSVRPISVQRGTERFRALRDRGSNSRDGLPKVSTWRLNLIGLSQIYDLLFVAYVDKIHVYRPEYPTQRLSDEPLLILDPPKTPMANSSYIDARHPHSINNLAVEFLGDLEIVLVVCDDGDVIGYYANEINTAINMRFDSDGPESILGGDVRAFFQQNVLASAWGISIHSRSRKIAVSCNNRLVTVFPFGLTTREWCGETEIDASLNDPTNRHHDQKFVLARMEGNIPAVAFCNTEDDPEGRLLICGSIVGSSHIWDLHKLEISDKIRAQFCVTPDGMACYCMERFPHAVWGLSFLDRRAFRRFRDYAPKSTDIGFWNAEATRAIVPDAQQTCTFLGAKYRASEMSNSSAIPQPGLQQTLPGLQQTGPLVEPTEISDPSSDFYSNIATEEADVRALQDRLSAPAVLRTLAKNNHPWMEDPTTMTSPRSFKYIGEESIRSPEESSPPQEFQRLNSWQRFPCPLIITSARDICLLQPADRNWSVHPVVGMEEPLRQELKSSHQSPWISQDLESSHRQSFQAQILELGLFILGSPIGRVAIFSLGQTEWPHSPRVKPVYFHRLDYLLPFASQENRGERPTARLAGVAVSPIQGQLGRSDGEVARKWRLIMYYVDHSVLSYELSKK